MANPILPNINDLVGTPTQGVFKTALQQFYSYVSGLVASMIPITPSGNITSLNIQTALQELDIKKAPTTNPTFSQKLQVSYAIGANDFYSEIGQSLGDYSNYKAYMYIQAASNSVRAGNFVLNPDGGNVGVGRQGSLNFKLDVASGFVNSISGYKTNGADYGEWFESLDGIRIPYGITVALEGGKIRGAKEGEMPIGVISATCSWQGNTGSEWTQKYLTDDLGCPIMEEYQYRIMSVKLNEDKTPAKDEDGNAIYIWTGRFETKTRQKINPEYDNTKEYILRENRPEWNIVGLVGQVRILKGQPTAPHWVKMKDISDNVELWLIK